MSAHLGSDFEVDFISKNALDVSILKKVVARPPEVIRGNSSGVLVKFQSYRFKS